MLEVNEKTKSLSKKKESKRKKKKKYLSEEKNEMEISKTKWKF